MKAAAPLHLVTLRAYPSYLSCRIASYCIVYLYVVTVHACTTLLQQRWRLALVLLVGAFELRYTSDEGGVPPGIAFEDQTCEEGVFWL